MSTENQNQTAPSPMTPPPGAAPAAGGRGSGGRNRRRRNRNRNRQNSNRSQSDDDMEDDPFGASAGTPGAKNGNNNSKNNGSPQKKKNQNNGNSKSKSPVRHNNNNNNNRQSKSMSPTRNNSCNSGHKKKSRGRNRHKHLPPPSDMTVIVNRSDLWDSAAHFQPEDNSHHCHPHNHPDVLVGPYFFAPDWEDVGGGDGGGGGASTSTSASGTDTAPSKKNSRSIAGSTTVSVVRVPHYYKKENLPNHQPPQHQGDNYSNALAAAAMDDPSSVPSSPVAPPSLYGGCDVIDTTMPNPHDPNVVHDKYWAQRRRLFKRFDLGCQLDPEGWYSVTPEIIADHVARRVADATYTIPERNGECVNGVPGRGEGIVMLDAFCGCGGNTIAFGKIDSTIISKVVCCDTDRNKLKMAAHNASLYDIPRDKLVFIECNSAFILQYCYKNGQFILDQPASCTTKLPPYLPPPVNPTTHAGYVIGGLDMLPRRIDAVFMDPPWGGVDYEVLGKNGYDLQKNMKIQVGPPVLHDDDYHVDGDGGDDFFDTFAGPTAKTTSQQKMSQKARKANFNKKSDGEFMDGAELLRVAAEATSSHLVIYDLPRNTNKMSLGKCALGAGYRGNVKLEEHFLNGRLKTVTAYMGADFGDLINSLHDNHCGGTSNDESL